MRASSALALTLALFAAVAAAAPVAADLRLLLPPAATSLTIDGTACPEAHRSTVDEWSTVLYFDPALLLPSAMERSAEALAAAAEALVARGPVEVVLVDPYPAAYLDPTRDAAALREALEILAEESVLAGELAEIRGDRAALDDQGSDRGRELAAEEDALWLRSRRALFSYAAVSDPATPGRALWLIEDGFRPPLGSQSFSAHVARNLAAAGWHLLGLASDEVPANLGASTAGLEALAAESGGRVLKDPAALPSFLDSAYERDLVICERAAADGEPLEVTSGPVDGGARWTSAGTPRALSVQRALAALEGEGTLEGGERRLALTGSLRVGPAPAATADNELEIAVLWPGGGAAATTVRLTLLAERLDAEPFVLHERFAVVGPVDGGVGSDWLFRRTLSVPEDVRAVAAVLEDLSTGAWGALRLPFSNAPFQPPVGSSVVAAGEPLGTAPPGGQIAASANGEVVAEPGDAPAPSTSAATTGDIVARADIADRVIVLLPPRRAGAGRLTASLDGAVTGRVRLQTLATSDAIERAVFYVDDREVGRDERAPFSAVVDLGDEATPRILKVVAESTGGRVLGEHAIEINRGAQPFRVSFTALEGEPATGSVRIAAEVQVPPRQRLAKVELYRNQDLLESLTAAALTEGRLERDVATPNAGPNDYLRVVAYLDDGQFLEDVVLLSAPALSDRVEVNLVEIFAVVSDRDGAPVKGLTAEDFRVERKGRPLAVDRFQVADEVPLVVGLLIDTSESMWGLMPDTKKAAARFLTETVLPQDAAFLVSFDDQPRLVHGISREVFDLIGAFGALNPGGSTALYDSIVFSLAQIEGNAGRRALVLLTDGQDAGSRFGYRRAIELARKQGVPIYILSLAGLGSVQLGGRPVRPFHYADLEAVTARTGGRLFDIDRLEQLAEAYAQINAELRNQYILGLDTQQPLSAEELAEIEVSVEGRGRRVRAAMGSAQ